MLSEETQALKILSQVSLGTVDSGCRCVIKHAGLVLEIQNRARDDYTVITHAYVNLTLLRNNNLTLALMKAVFMTVVESN